MDKFEFDGRDGFIRNDDRRGSPTVRKPGYWSVMFSSVSFVCLVLGVLALSTFETLFTSFFETKKAT